MIFDVTEPPSRRYTLTLFTGLGAAHGLLMNGLSKAPWLSHPLWLVWRTACGFGIGLLVDYYMPIVSRISHSELAYAEQMAAWEEGVKQRRRLESELLHGNKTQHHAE